MTEAEIQAADEHTLRERVRELISATGTLREVRDILSETKDTQLAIHSALNTITFILRQILLEKRSRPAKKASKRKRKAARKSKRG